MGKVVCIINRKGGVGKTTITLGIADTLVGQVEAPFTPGRKLVAAVDLDPQGSLTRALLSERGHVSEDGQLREVIKQRRTLAYALEARLTDSSISLDRFLKHGVGPTGATYSLLANEARAWNVERQGLKRPGEVKLQAAFTRMIRDLAAEFEYVLIDSPPGQTALAEAAIRASDLIICPITPDWLSFWGLESFDAYVRTLFEEMPEAKHPKARFVFTKFRNRVSRADPQNTINDLVEKFRSPDRYVTLLREIGKEVDATGGPIRLPHDPKLLSRLEGSPSTSRIWPWAKFYSAPTQKALLTLVNAIKEELVHG